MKIQAESLQTQNMLDKKTFIIQNICTYPSFLHSNNSHLPQRCKLKFQPAYPNMTNNTKTWKDKARKVRRIQQIQTVTENKPFCMMHEGILQRSFSKLSSLDLKGRNKSWTPYGNHFSFLWKKKNPNQYHLKVTQVVVTGIPTNQNKWFRVILKLADIEFSSFVFHYQFPEKKVQSVQKHIT